jgi:hypothetical protein
MGSNETNYNNIPEKDTIHFSIMYLQPEQKQYEVEYNQNDISGNATIYFNNDEILIKYEFERIKYIDTIKCDIPVCNRTYTTSTTLFLKGFNRIDSQMKKGFEYKDKNEYPFYLNITITYIRDRNVKICHIRKKIPEIKKNTISTEENSDEELDLYERIKSPKRKRGERNFYSDDGGPASKAPLEFSKKKVKT